MRKSLFLTLFLLFAALALQAQQYDVLDQVRQDVRLSYGMEGPHRFDHMGPLTKAPKGYRPFYVSHYGRHGSRYAWNSRTYLLIHDVLDSAARKGLLTPYGEAFREKYEAFYMEPWINSGDLVPLGFDQHRKIGEFVYRSFPQVFQGRRQVYAVSSVAQRCIVSMGAFNLGLQSGNPQLQITLASTHDAMCIVAPPSAPRSLVRHFAGEHAPVDLEDADSYAERIVPAGDILSRLFTDTAFLDAWEDGSWDFLNELWALYTGYHNYEPRPLFDDLFTDDERVKAWEANNYFSFWSDIHARYRMIPLLEDIIGKASEALENPAVAAHLRFGHDYIIEALACLLNINGCGTIPAAPEEAKYWFQSYNIPMATTLLLVFYKNKKDDILFKVVFNEQEASLPDLQAVTGPYYRWADFLAWADALMKAHPETARK